jgi:hypothetical protein
MRCRDSSLYGRVQTISQDLLLDLLKHGNLCDFCVFAFSHVSCFRASCVFTHLTYCAHFVIPHSSYFVHSHISRVSHFRVFCISRFLRFDMRYRAPPWDPLHSIRMSCPHPPRSIGVYFTLFHLHYIIYVFAFPFMFTYLVMCLYYITLVRLALPTWLRGLGICLAC